MFLNKKKVILVISVSALVFFLTYTDVKSQNLKITDGDTIKINGEKIADSKFITDKGKSFTIQVGKRKFAKINT